MGQATKGLPGVAVEDQMVAKLFPPRTAFLSPESHFLGITQRQLRALTRAPAVYRVEWLGGKHGIK